jgi:hypothetical protein
LARTESRPGYLRVFWSIEEIRGSRQHSDGLCRRRGQDLDAVFGGDCHQPLDVERPGGSVHGLPDLGEELLVDAAGVTRISMRAGVSPTLVKAWTVSRGTKAKPPGPSSWVYSPTRKA